MNVINYWQLITGLEADDRTLWQHSSRNMPLNKNINTNKICIVPLYTIGQNG